jgi:hypothetical protein
VQTGFLLLPRRVIIGGASSQAPLPAGLSVGEQKKRIERGSRRDFSSLRVSGRAGLAIGGDVFTTHVQPDSAGRSES